MKNFLFKPSNFKMFMRNAIVVPGLLIGIFGSRLIDGTVNLAIGITFVTIGVLWAAWAIAYTAVNNKR
jgi:hypothetical protein